MDIFWRGKLSQGKHKYGAKRTEVNGISFASKGEAGLYEMLWALERVKRISGLRVQEKIYLTRARILMKPDFAYEVNGRTEYAEYKGMETPEWKLKRRLWLAYGPGVLHVYKGKNQLVESLDPQSAVAEQDQE